MRSISAFNPFYLKSNLNHYGYVLGFSGFSIISHINYVKMQNSSFISKILMKVKNILKLREIKVKTI